MYPFGENSRDPVTAYEDMMNDPGNAMWSSEYGSEAEAEAASAAPFSGGTREADSQGERRTNPTVGIVDPRSLTREGLVKLLESTQCFRVVAVAQPAELLTKASEERISVGIILLGLGATLISDESVRADIASLTEAFPEVPIIVLCDLNDSQHIGEALRQGIRGYIPTTLTSRILIEALRLIQAGGTFIPADALSAALSDRRSTAPETSSAVDRLGSCRLTPRQREVLGLLREGKPNKIIAYELAMRESTVKVHVRQIMRKLRASNRTEAAFLASNLQQS
jgi:DNA-binding NarL/FixJ family response regulator